MLLPEVFTIVAGPVEPDRVRPPAVSGPVSRVGEVVTLPERVRPLLIVNVPLPWVPVAPVAIVPPVVVAFVPVTKATVPVTT